MLLVVAGDNCVVLCCSYVLLVVAGDRSTQPLFSNATIINVAVLDENDNNPEILNIDSGVTRVQVPEVRVIHTISCPQHQHFVILMI